jgi:hypothetical protein
MKFDVFALTRGDAFSNLVLVKILAETYFA